jgi:uridine kinase/ribulose-5-phosphate 4-epimerase/fuculose-1-phosphate aldolase
MSKTVIAIAGPSGAGKTTLASLINFLQERKSTTIISGDSFHLWPRNDSNWNTHTHLNPAANDLAGAFKVISELKSGKDVPLRRYNHDTGKFDEPKLQKSNDVIIYEGLHALYGEDILSIADLKIYVDTSPELTREWKIARDTSSRGYKSEDVEKELIRREKDQKKYIEVQKEFADVVVRLEKRKNKVRLKVVKGNLPFLQEVFEAMEDFLTIGRELSSDISLVHGAGGNFSVKVEGRDSFIIKSSGIDISSIDITQGFVLCDRGSIAVANSEREYNTFLQKSALQGTGRPSMETGFHASLDARVVVHCHPVYLNAILCSNESREVIRKLFSDYLYIPYTTPGYKLHSSIGKGYKKIIFLENHGLIVASECVDEAIDIAKSINEACRDYLRERNINTLNHLHPTPQPLFPDMVIFPEGLKVINDFILNLIVNAGLHPRFLTNEQKEELLILEAEKYRKNL